jgi:hypothetical protein
VSSSGRRGGRCWFLSMWGMCRGYGRVGSRGALESGRIPGCYDQFFELNIVCIVWVEEWGDHTIPASSSSLILLGEVAHAGAVHPE